MGRPVTGFVRLGAAAVCAAWLSVALAADNPADAIDGVWAPTVAAGRPLLDSHGTQPPLLPAARALYQQRGAQRARGDTSYDLSIKCKPMGFPRVLWDGGPFDIQLQPKLVFLGYTWNRNHRTADVGSGAPAPQIPRYYGTSIAHWDGTALVVESAGFKDTTLLDSSGLPHSDQLSISEHYLPDASGQNLEVQLHLTDPVNYRRPWDVTLHFHKIPNGRILEDVCEQHAAFYKGLFPGND
jgi:hypothetical protein